LAYTEATPNGRTVLNRLTYGERAMTRPQLSQIHWIDLEEDKAAREDVFGLLAEMERRASGAAPRARDRTLA
jgi:hypothetical protein